MRGERRRRYSFAERLRRIPATRMVRPRQARLTGESRVATWPRAVRRPFDHRTDATARRQGKSIQFGIVPGPTNVSPLQDSGLASRSDAGITAAPGDGTPNADENSAHRLDGMLRGDSATRPSQVCRSVWHRTG